MFRKFFYIDWILVSSYFLLILIGLATLYGISASEYFQNNNIFFKQVIFASLGIGVFLFFSFFDYKHYKYYAKLFYFLIIFILLSVLLWGNVVRGTTGWIGVGIFNVQPVEVAKLLLVITLASFISKKKNKVSEIAAIVNSFFLAFVAVFLVLKQPDLGSALILAGIWLGMSLISGMSSKYFIFILFSGVILFSFGWVFLEDYQKDRLINFIYPEKDPQGSGYNVIQSMIAVGSGGFLGQGIGKGSQSQLNFLPEKHTDFIFASIAEEFGFVGSFLVLFLFTLLFYRIKKIAQNASDNFGYLLAIGIGIMFFLEVLINAGMNLGIMPVTGIPLPFLSYGGSSLIASSAALGILFNIRKG